MNDLEPLGRAAATRLSPILPTGWTLGLAGDDLVLRNPSGVEGAYELWRLYSYLQSFSSDLEDEIAETTHGPWPYRGTKDNGLPRPWAREEERIELGYVAASFSLFAIPAAAGYLLALAFPDLLQTLLPESLRQSLERHELWTNIDEQLRPYAASLIMTNNIFVSFFAFAGGAVAGTLTVVVLVQNGLQLGAIFAATQTAGLAIGLLTFIAGHGFVELSVIFLSGGAGLRLASAFVAPGDLSRSDALRIRGAQALRIVMFCIPCLVVAGLIEGFLSPSAAPAEAKLAVGLLTGGALWSYLLLAGRG